MARIYTDSVVVGFPSIIRTAMTGTRRQRMKNRIAMREDIGIDSLIKTMTRRGLGGSSGSKVGELARIWGVGGWLIQRNGGELYLVLFPLFREDIWRWELILRCRFD